MTTTRNHLKAAILATTFSATLLAGGILTTGTAAADAACSNKVGGFASTDGGSITYCGPVSLDPSENTTTGITYCPFQLQARQISTVTVGGVTTGVAACVPRADSQSR
ncbi:hypothetical protein ACFWPV_36950 [Streptomyces uncialis]|uniref:hypothetical protein n=1 Tax=Streptomyces uncialis TaxID=1048205 RepID=UPI0036615A17